MTIAQGEIPPTSLTPESLLVPVDSEVFKYHPDAPYYIGVVAMNGFELQPELYEAAGRLRANVYIDEKRFLPATARNADGTERDYDDNRSVHLVAVENQGLHLPPRLIGTARMILKRSPEDDLPVEHYYPDCFAGDAAAPVRSAEVSRYIARHESKQVQALISLGLIRAAAAWLDQNVHRPAYAVVEAGLVRMFDKIGLPYTEVSGYRSLEEYGDTRNMAIQMDPERVLQNAKAENHISTPSMLSPDFFGKAYVHKGVGYFNHTLTRAL